MKGSRIPSVVTASLFSLSTAAFANVYSFISLPGATLDGLPVSATAQFTTAPGTITLALTNNISNPRSIIQAISDIFFTASGVTGGGGLKTPTANLVTIGSDSSPLVGNPQWLLTNTSGNNYHLDVLAGPATGPATLIIGPGPYTNANGSISGNNPHNPFINTSATWTLVFAGATAAPLSPTWSSRSVRRLARTSQCRSRPPFGCSVPACWGWSRSRGAVKAETRVDRPPLPDTRCINPMRGEDHKVRKPGFGRAFFCSKGTAA